MQQQPQQSEQQQQPQQPAALGGSLQALLGNPELLSAAILGGAGGSSAGGSFAAQSVPSLSGGLSVDPLHHPTSMGSDDTGSLLFGSTGDLGGGFGGFGDLAATFSAGFGGGGVLSEGLDQGTTARFADEGDEDPYDPTMEG